MDQGAEALRTLGEQLAPQAMSVASPPRQTRTFPVEPALTTIWVWNRARPRASTATTSVTP
ncbi:hypothetical protein D3C77_817860 [compost metagenome]